MRARRHDDREDDQRHACGADGRLIGIPVVPELVQQGDREHLENLDIIRRLLCVRQLDVWKAVVERELELPRAPLVRYQEREHQRS